MIEFLVFFNLLRRHLPYMGTILQEILSEPPSADTIRKFDELSNALCLVADSLSVISGTMYNISSILNVVHPIIYLSHFLLKYLR